MDAPRFLVGRLLLAMPGIGDPRFERAVIAICAHDADGALGIGIGSHVPGLTLHALMKQLDIEPGAAPDAPVHAGGPVEPNRGFVLHSEDWDGEGSVDVAGRWRLTATLDVLKAIAAGTGPSRWLAALGYAGWSAGQLDDEMARHGWYDVEGRQEMIFDRPPALRWSGAFADAGIDVRLLASQPGTA
ncbi:MAG TPA: YqgE/AlgH family protein [Sphingomonas sp.]